MSYHIQPLNNLETYVYGLKSRAHRHHCLGYGFFDVDMAVLRAERKKYSKHVMPVTWTPFLLKAIALTLAKHPEANRILFKRWWGGVTTAVYHDIDVNIPITRKWKNRPLTFLGVVRQANTMSIADIQKQIRHMQRCDESESESLAKIARLEKAPTWFSSIFHALMQRSPTFYSKQAGTCGMTMLEGQGQHFMPIGPTSVIFSFGGYGATPVVQNHQIVVGERLHVCLAVDNYVISGPLAAALAATFKDLIESENSELYRQ
jgi:pyruvate/2-oxoglutarate dehydrogenase complex dihydrolipoamide acyltransferase (E2) component